MEILEKIEILEKLEVLQINENFGILNILS